MCHVIGVFQEHGIFAAVKAHERLPTRNKQSRLLRRVNLRHRPLILQPALSNTSDALGSGVDLHEVLGAQLKQGREGLGEVLEEKLVVGRVHVHVPEKKRRGAASRQRQIIERRETQQNISIGMNDATIYGTPTTTVCSHFLNLGSSIRTMSLGSIISRPLGSWYWNGVKFCGIRIFRHHRHQQQQQRQ